MTPSSLERLPATAAAIIQASTGVRGRAKAWTDPWGHWLLVGGLVGSPALAREAQTLEVLDQAEAALHQHGLAFSDVIRTWFVLDDILDWYAGFNAVRTAFFEARGIFERVVPASTGVGGTNDAGSAVFATLLAVRPRSEALSVKEIASPKQCDAREYSSSFSRAVAVSWPGSRRLYVSGTASIDSEGRSLHRGNVSLQIVETLDVVGELLQSVDMRWADVLEAKAYFRRDDAQGVALLRSRGLTAPLRCARAEICRDELLFELELSAGQGPSPNAAVLP